MLESQAAMCESMSRTAIASLKTSRTYSSEEIWLYALNGKIGFKTYKLVAPRFPIGTERIAYTKLRNGFLSEQSVLGSSGLVCGVKGKRGPNPIFVKGEPPYSNQELRNADIQLIAGAMVRFCMEGRKG